MEKRDLQYGDVVQLSPTMENSFFPGCFMYVTEPKSWGAQGFIMIPASRTEPPGEACFRAKWEEMEYVGCAPWQRTRNTDFEE